MLFFFIIPLFFHFLFLGGGALVVFNIESFDANLELYFISVFIVG